MAKDANSEIDDLASEYEAARRADKPASMEDILGRAKTHNREALFEELMAVEVELSDELGCDIDWDHIVRVRDGVAPTIISDGSAPGQVDTSYNDFVLCGRIGKGGICEVHKAWQLSLRRYVAIKYLRTDNPYDAQLDERLIREAHAYAKLEGHPNVVQVIAVGRKPSTGVVFIAMQLVGNGKVSLKIRNGPLPIDECVSVVVAITCGVGFAHKRGVIHRDLKPDNILFDTDGTVKVADFGLAKIVNWQERKQLTVLGDVFGTPCYMAPEQYDPNHEVDLKVDIWAIGCILYEILTGTRPFLGDVFSIRDKVLKEKPVLLTTLRPEIHPELQRICLKCLEKNPEDRHQSATVLLGELEYFQRTVLAPDGVAGPAKRDDRVPREQPSSVALEKKRGPVSWPIGRTMLSVVSGIAILAVVVGGAFYFLKKNEQGPPATADGRDGMVAEWVRSVGGKVRPPEKGGRIVEINLQDVKAVANDDLKRICRLDSLENLNLHGTSVGDSGVQHLKNLPKLSVLNLNLTDVTDTGLTDLGEFESLSHLYLASTKVSDGGLRHLARVSKLEVLHLANSEVVGNGLSHLRNLSKLKALALAGKKVHFVELEKLKEFKNIDGFDYFVLLDTPMTDAALDSLRCLPKGIPTLWISKSGLSERAMESFRKEYQHVEFK